MPGIVQPQVVTVTWSAKVQEPTTIYSGACKLYKIVLTSYTGGQRAYINDAVSGSGNQKFQVWVPDARTHVFDLADTPMQFNTGLRVSWLSGTSSHLELLACYKPD